MDKNTEKFLQMVARGLKMAVASAGQYLVHNGRSILGLFSLLLVGWGGVVISLPNRKVYGELMIATGSVLRAWLSDSSSKSPKVEAANATA
jgi:hypothetical protein